VFTKRIIVQQNCVVDETTTLLYNAKYTLSSNPAVDRRLFAEFVPHICTFNWPSQKPLSSPVNNLLYSKVYFVDSICAATQWVSTKCGDG